MGKFLTVAGSAAAGGLGAVLAAPVMLGFIGFTSSGIAAGSFAARMMSAAAAANGGEVAAGSLVAYLQSAGAAGLSANATAAVAMIGSSIAACFGWLGSFFQEKKKKKRKEEDDNITFKIVAVTLFLSAIYLQQREVRGRRRK